MNLGGGVVMAGTFLLLSQFLQMVDGLSPLEAGLSLKPLNVAMAAGSMLAPQLARRYRPCRDAAETDEATGATLPDRPWFAELVNVDAAVTRPSAGDSGARIAPPSRGWAPDGSHAEWLVCRTGW